MRAMNGEEGAKRAAITQGLRGGALAYGMKNKEFAPYMKTAREGVKAGVAWANGEVDPKVFVPPSDAVYFSLLETESEVEPKDLLSTSSQITTAAKQAAAGAHLINELSKFEEAKNAKKKPLKRLKPAAEKVADLAKKAALASEAIATVGHTMRAMNGEEGARRAAITQGLRGGALAYGMKNKEFASIMKTAREGVKAGVAWANGEVDSKVFVPPSDAVYFG